MNTLFDEDDRDETKSDADLTLGIGSLLSIFFGVVLICGIFFGFGYSMGRRNARPAILPAATQPAQTAATAPPLPENELSGAPLKPAAPDDSSAPGTSAASSDSADSTPAKASAPAKQPAPDNSAAKPSKATRVVEPAATDPSLSAVPYAHRPPLPTKPHAGISAPLAQAPGDSPIIPGHPIMVQIAAVSRQEDAEVLAGALRKRGFNPTVRPGTSDKFFHVQVGPFTDKPQADAMKQHLLADGYNAIVK
jgi:cell division septation protein DedD